MMRFLDKSWFIYLYILSLDSAKCKEHCCFIYSYLWICREFLSCEPDETISKDRKIKNI